MYLFVSFANKTPVLRMFGASNADGINDACQYNNMDMQDSTWDPRYPNASYTFSFPYSTTPGLREEFMVRTNRVLPVVVQFPLSLLLALLLWL